MRAHWAGAGGEVTDHADCRGFGGARVASVRVWKTAGRVAVLAIVLGGSLRVDGASRYPGLVLAGDDGAALASGVAVAELTPAFPCIGVFFRGGR